MTSASELFYTRRSRYGRNWDTIESGSGSGSGLVSPPHPDRAFYAPRRIRSPCVFIGPHTRRDRTDPDGCDPLTRAPHHHIHPRQPPVHRTSRPPHERGPVWVELGGQGSPSGNAGQFGRDGNQQARIGDSRSDRLPGAVLLARERLMQRLRGVTISAGRRNNTNTSRDHQNSIAISDDVRLVDAGDWETEVSREWAATLAPSVDSTLHQMGNRPIGHTKGVLNLLHVEVLFYVPDEGTEQSTSRAFRECSICLESFVEGDVLTRLPCEHRYHFCCLEPWVRTRQDCPYCRRAICARTDKV